MFDEANEALMGCDYRKIEREVDEMLEAAGLPALDHNSADFRRLCRRFLLAKIEYTRIEADRWNGIYNHVQRPGAPTPTSSSKPKTEPSGPLFFEIIERYFHESPRAARSAEQTRAEFAKFVTVLGGDRPVSAITKAHVRAYKDDMLQTRELKLATVGKHIATLSGLFRWCEKQGHIPDGSNPTKGLAPDKKAARRQAKARKAFSDKELFQVFGSKEFMIQRDKNPARFWICLICLFEICRREEAAQLNVSDIGEEKELHYIHITTEGSGDKTLKNEGSTRRVPIHSALIKLGLLDYVSRIKATGHTRLFPQLKKGGNTYGDAVGKFFSRLVTKAGLTDPGLVLHSLRHGGISKLANAGVAQNIREILAGHAAEGIHEQVYVHRDQISLGLLKDGLEKLRYDEIVTRLC